MKLNVHWQIHTYSEIRKIVTLERVDVYHQAWRHIIVIVESTFYRYAKHALQNMVAQLYETHAFTSQDCIQYRPLPHFEKLADQMLYRSCILSSDDKVVTKVLCAIWKWKDTILELNEVNTSFNLK